MNVKGLFNKENSTKVEEEETTDMADTGNEGMLDSQFHKNFWSLQQFFSNPSLVTSNKEKWETFLSHTDLSLAAFESHTLNLTSTSTKDEDDSKADDANKAYAIKYLTSKRLIRLQLRDVAVRRNILVQYLILLGCLR